MGVKPVSNRRKSTERRGSGKGQARSSEDPFQAFQNPPFEKEDGLGKKVVLSKNLTMESPCFSGGARSYFPGKRRTPPRIKIQPCEGLKGVKETSLQRQGVRLC